jgi:ribonuclease P protein component
VIPAGLSPALASGDFERALAVRPKARTEHFLLHHLGPLPMLAAELSTSEAEATTQAVDDWRRFGQIVPKRHARRAVTRNLIRRQARAAFGQHGAALSAGDWFLRMKAPFPVAQFPSAASAALKQAVRAELDRLFQAAARA